MVHWVKEYPDEWLPYDKVPKGLRVAFERRNATRSKGGKGQDTSSVETSVKANAVKMRYKYLFLCIMNV